MRFSVLALDYDGTIAENGELNERVRIAISEVRSHGVAVVLVTGRILRDLQQQLADLRLFDAVVAENGAVSFHPQSGRLTLLGQPAPSSFLESLKANGINVLAGECVVEAEASDAASILHLIRDSELPLVMAFNRSRVMILPQAISKATGLREMLTAMRGSLHNTLAIGDAENDHELLAAAEMGVAVSWGSAQLKAAADMVLEGPGPDAVAEYITRVAASLRLPASRRRRHLLLGKAEDGNNLSLAVLGRNVLISGDPISGKSWLTGLLSEQLILLRYSICVIDVEGDYSALEALPGVMVLGGEEEEPNLRELTRVLHHPDVSVVIDLSRMKQEEKRSYVTSLLQMLAAHRRQTGLPHWIVVDEAHYFLHEEEAQKILDLELAGYIMVTHRASQLQRNLLATGGAIIVTRETDPAEARALLAMQGMIGDTTPGETLLGNLAISEAVLFPGTEESCGNFCKFKLAPRLTSHVRHRHKYFDVPVPKHKEFVFAQNEVGQVLSARTLKEFSTILPGLAQEALEGHLRRGDFSRWIEKVFGDLRLASEIRAVEIGGAVGHKFDARGAIVKLIRSRYFLRL